MSSADDPRWMNAAMALGERGRGQTYPNPNVGAVIVRDGRVVGRGWTQPGGRPHAEAMALSQSGEAARGGTLYVTLEPCAHVSARGPACADLLPAAGLARVVFAVGDPDPRTKGVGAARLRDAGIAVVEAVEHEAAARSMAGYLTRQTKRRPHVTLKLAMSLDGCIAMADGRSRWITGEAARAHAHLERARADAILVGGETLRADVPRLDVRLPGLDDRSPVGVVMTTGRVPEGWTAISGPDAIAALAADSLLVEGGMGVAASLLRDDLVDRLLIYRAPIMIGGGRVLDGIGLDDLDSAHGRWRWHDGRAIGSDRFDTYDRIRG